MGGTSKTENKVQNTQQATTGQFANTAAQNPWAPAVPAVTGILSGVQGISPQLTGAETDALSRLSENAAAGNPFTGQIGNLATDLFSGGTDRTGIVSDAYNAIRTGLAPTAEGKFLDPFTNPFFDSTTQGITDMVKQRIDALYSGAGRDPAGAGSYGGMLGDAVSQALAPYFMNAYNTERDRMLGANKDLFSAGTGTAGLLSGLDQTALANRMAGVGVGDQFLGAQNYGPNQMMAIEAARRGIPLHTLQQQAGIAFPAAGLGGTSEQSGTSSGTMTGSGMTNTTATAPFNPLALAPLGILPFTTSFNNPFATGAQVPYGTTG